MAACNRTDRPHFRVVLGQYPIELIFYRHVNHGINLIQYPLESPSSQVIRCFDGNALPGLCDVDETDLLHEISQLARGGHPKELIDSLPKFETRLHHCTCVRRQGYAIDLGHYRVFSVA